MLPCRSSHVCCRIHRDPFHPEWLAAGGENTGRPTATCCIRVTFMPVVVHTTIAMLHCCQCQAASFVSKPEPSTAANESADQPLPRPEECNDEHDKCGDWAAAGECEHNRGYMVKFFLPSTSPLTLMRAHDAEKRMLLGSQECRHVEPGASICFMVSA